MGQTLVIQPVSRIEGHAKVTIQLDDSGDVTDARVNVIELRGFEKFCVGRPVEEMPRITTRICGVCPWSHHLAAAKRPMRSSAWSRLHRKETATTVQQHRLHGGTHSPLLHPRRSRFCDGDPVPTTPRAT